jgi:hypothetical protein
MSTDPIADLVDHPPRHDPPVPARLADTVLVRVHAASAAQRRAWWPLALLIILILTLLPGGDATMTLDPAVIGYACECVLMAGGLLLLVLLANRGIWGTAWKA